MTGISDPDAGIGADRPLLGDVPEPLWSHEAASARIEAALKVAAKDTSELSRDGIPYAALIPFLAAQLILMRSPIVSTPPSSAKVLKRVNKLAGALILCLKQLDSATWYRVGAKLDLETIPRIWISLEKLRTASNAAALPARKGAPVKVGHAKIARFVAGQYYFLTGNKPTVPKRDGKAYGPFLTLLSEVFKALGIKVSAESQAEKVVRDWTAPTHPLYGIK